VSELLDEEQAQQLKRMQRMKIMRAIDLVTDGGDFYQQAKSLGTEAARALGRDKRSQITGLESLANSSQKVTDVFDYIKLRTARQKEWRIESFGSQLLDFLEQTLPKKRQEVLDHTGITEPGLAQQQDIYMLLIRTFLAHLAAQYEYACQEQGGT